MPTAGSGSVVNHASAAGGGFPQWNCNCRLCAGQRQGALNAHARTQSSIAVSADGESWVLGVVRRMQRSHPDEVTVGVEIVARKLVRPSWGPPLDIWRANPNLPALIPGGSPRNPMGARVIGLGPGGEYAIHGTNMPGTVGTAASYGCFRMHNHDVADLYDRVRMGTPVVVSDLGAVPETVLAPPQTPPNERTGWRVEPGNAAAQALLPRVTGHDPATSVVTTLAEEKQFNTFFRLGSASVIAQLREAFPDLPEHPDRRTVFARLRELRNRW